jgi:mannosyltransferase
VIWLRPPARLSYAPRSYSHVLFESTTARASCGACSASGKTDAGWTDRLLASPAIHRLAFTLTVLIAAALSWTRIGSKSFWLDEAFSVAVASLDLRDLWHVISGDQANMAVYYLLLHWWLDTGTSEAMLRTLSAVFAVGSLVPLYAIGTRLYSRPVGIIACLMLGMNAFFIQYAQEARAYSLLLLLTTTSSYVLVTSFVRPTVGAWLAYVAVSSLTVYTHVFGLLFVGAHAIALAFAAPRPVPWRFHLSAFVAIGLIIAPMLVVVVTVRHAGWVAPTTFDTLVRTTVELTGYGGRSLAAFYAVLVILGLGARRRARPRQSTGWQDGFVLTWLVLPVVTAVVFSVLVRPIVVGRYLIGVLPALALLAAAGVWGLRWGVLRAAALAMLLTFAAGGLSRWYGGMPKEDWRSAVRYVLAQAEPGDRVAFHPRYIRTAFDYYALPREGWHWTPPSSYPGERGKLGHLDAHASSGSFVVWLMISKERYAPLTSLEPRWLRPPPEGSFCPAKEWVFHKVRVMQLLPCRLTPAG